MFQKIFIAKFSPYTIIYKANQEKSCMYAELLPEPQTNYKGRTKGRVLNCVIYCIQALILPLLFLLSVDQLNVGNILSGH